MAGADKSGGVPEGDAKAGGRADGGDIYRFLFEQNPTPMWIYEIGTLRFLAVNEAALWRYGYTRGEFLAMTIADIRPPEDLPRLKEMMRDHPSGFRDAGRWRHLLKSGALIDVEIQSARMDFDGRPGMLVIARDVTELTRTLAALREVEARFQAVVQNSPIAISLKDRDGRYLYFNAESLRALRLADGGYLGKTALEVLEPAAAALVVEADRKLLETGQPQVVEVDFPGGVPYDNTLMVCVPVLEGAGAVVAIGSFATSTSASRNRRSARCRRPSSASSASSNWCGRRSGSTTRASSPSPTRRRRSCSARPVRMS